MCVGVLEKSKVSKHINDFVPELVDILLSDEDFMSSDR